MNYVGIDGGVTGAIAAISSSGSVLLLEDTPILMLGHARGSKKDYDIWKMRTNLLKCKVNDISPVVGLELAHAFPDQGVTSMFNFGRGLGLWEGLIVMAGYKYDKVAPQTWKKIMLKDMGKDKDASRLRACQLFPDQPLSLKIHHGRAEALLIAEYMRRTA